MPKKIDAAIVPVRGGTTTMLWSTTLVELEAFLTNRILSGDAYVTISILLETGTTYGHFLWQDRTWWSQHSGGSWTVKADVAQWIHSVYETR